MASVRKALYYGTHRLIGSSIGQVYEDILKQDQARALQDTPRGLLARMLNHCERHVPYYAELISQRGRPFEQNPESYLAQLPILTKELIRRNFDQLKSDDLPQRRWFYNTSGGSTGEPVRLIQDRAFTDRQMAVQMLSYDWAGRKFGERAVRVWGSERDILQGSVGLKMQTLNRLTNDTWFNAFRMTPQAMHRFVSALNAHPPKLIVAYAQAIYELARFVEREKMTVVPQSAILTSATTLYPFMREKIEAVFQCKVFDRYGSREVGDIACECPSHAGLHVLPWLNYVEVVDEKGNPVPPGVEGNLIVTNLSNYAMPLIRYWIGDRGILSPETNCACGRQGQIMAKVSGRNADAFRTADGTLVYGAYFTHLLYFKAWVLKFQVIQTSYASIIFKIVKASSDLRPEELDEIAENTRAVLGRDCAVRFEFVDDIPPSPSGKYRYTISEVAA